MAAQTTGRNDPCPCGSGLKFKKCCLRNNQPPASHGGAAAASEALHEAMQGRQFDSQAELQSFIDNHTRQVNQRPLEEFHGLSSEQMYRLLYFPFASPGLIEHPEVLSSAPSAPVMLLFGTMTDAIGDKGVKATAKGNLPRQLCQDALTMYRSQKILPNRLLPRNISSEEDFYELHFTRLLAEVAGLVRKYKGRLILSRQCKSLLEANGAAAIYPRLFRACVEQSNWGYGDRYPDLQFIQTASHYSLYVLTQSGDKWRPPTFYEDRFLRAFPDVVREAPADNFSSREETVRNCYSLRTFSRFVGFFGLGTIELDPRKNSLRAYRIRSAPLLFDAVRFHFGK